MFNLKIKKMKVLKYLSLAALSMCFASCSEDNSVTLKVETELGGLSEFVTVMLQEVNVSAAATVMTIKLLQNLMASEYERYGNHYVIQSQKVACSLLADDGTIVTSVEGIVQVTSCK